MCGGGYTESTPTTTYTADDGTTFTDVAQYNNYETALRRTTYNNAMASAYQSALTKAQNEFTNLGLNYSDYASQVQDILDQEKSTIPDLATDPSSYYTDAAQTVINNNTAQAQKAYQDTFNDTYGNNYSNSIFNTDTDTEQSLLNELYNEQYTPDAAAVQNAIDRGQLVGTGVDYANTQLGTQSDAAKATILKAMANVNSTYTSALNDVATNANSAISSYALGDNFDVNDWLQSYADKLSSLSDTYSGDVRNALGSSDLFDVNTLLNNAGTVQGASNGEGGVLATATDTATKNNQKRGLGSTGAF